MQDLVDNYNVCNEGKSSSISSTDSGITIETMDRNCEQLGNKISDKLEKSPALSIRSTVISINSIESSVLDSDSDEENVDGLIVKKLGETTPENPDPSFLKTPGVILSQIVENGLPSGGIIAQNTNQRAQIGSVVVDRSNEVTFGDKNYFQGPVTIKQFVVDSSLKINNGKEGGNVNHGYDLDTDGVHSNKPSSKKYNNSERNISREPEDKFVYKNITVKKKSLYTGLVVAIIALVFFIIGIIVWTTQTQSKNYYYKLGDGDDDRKNIPVDSTIDRDNIGSGLVLRRVTRDEWVAQPPRTKLDKLNLPVSKVVIAHTATERCEVQSACVFRVRYIQTFHMDSKKWDDIGYNFLIGEDGMVYDGRGWDNQGAHTKGYNVDSVGIAFIGTFNDLVPLNKSINVFNLLIQEGIRLGKLKKDYKLYGQRQLNGSESPGSKFYEVIKTWAHWSDKI